MRFQSLLGYPRGLKLLDPLLFLLYINDLPENILSQVRLFANDTAVYLTVSNANDSSILQSDLNSLPYWERTWGMEFNPRKCQVLHISRSRSPIKSKYYMHCQELESEDSAKCLEVNKTLALILAGTHTSAKLLALLIEL